MSPNDKKRATPKGSPHDSNTDLGVESAGARTLRVWPGDQMDLYLDGLLFGTAFVKDNKDGWLVRVPPSEVKPPLEP